MPRKPKIVAFAIVLLAAAALVAHSLHGRGGSSVGTPGHQGPGHTCPYGEEGGKSALDFSPQLAELIGDKDFVFVVLPGESNQRAEAVRGLVDGALATISTRGVSATSVTLGKDADGHAELVANFAIESFPGVLAIGRSHRTAAVSGEVTEEKLLRAFVVASTAAPGCGDCDPATCGQAQ